MNTKSLNKWANAHTSYPLDLLRVALGIFLIITGASFITGNQQLVDVVSPVSNFTGGMFIFHYVAAAHIVGGIMIAFGLLTRWAIWAQLPILIGAVLVNFVDELILLNLILAVLTLMLCIFFLIYGGGKHSADYYFKLQL